MVKELFLSLKNNINEKTRNPFLGTYVIVWSIRNWEFIFTLFNFDDKTTLEEKKKLIQEYFNNNSFIPNILENILWTIGALISTYLLLNFSRLIINLSDKKLTPYIYKITDKSTIVLKSTFETLKVEKNDLEDKISKLRADKGSLSVEISSLDAKNTELANKIAELIAYENETKRLTNENTKLLKEIEKLQGINKKDAEEIKELISKNQDELKQFQKTEQLLKEAKEKIKILKYSTKIDLSKEPKVSNSYNLTSLEIEILALIAKGYSSDEIAEKLSISSSAVDMSKEIMKKTTNTKSTRDLIKFAWENTQLFK